METTPKMNISMENFKKKLFSIYGVKDVSD